MLAANSIPPSQGRSPEQEGFRSRFVAVVDLQIRRSSYQGLRVPMVRRDVARPR